jgi:drug/metabolite transporter (DMT)-like permease
MYVGLTMTYASVFQMLRGSVVIFTGILSVVFLKRKLYVFHWLGMICVLIGATLVGVASVMDSGSNTTHVAHPPSNPLVGDILIVGAQVCVITYFSLYSVYIQCEGESLN